MSNIDIELTGFTGSYAHLNGATTEFVGWSDIVRCIVTVGMVPNTPLFPADWKSFCKSVSLASMALCVLDSSGKDLQVSRLFKSLDPSEKSSFSYWLGMALLKFATESQLDVGWLMHVDPLISSGDVALVPGTRSRGDLVGADFPGMNWHVIESKGRSSRVRTALMTSAKIQAGNIASVYGMPPATNCAGGVSLGAIPVSVVIEDPPPNNPQGGGFTQDIPSSFFSAYYRCISDYLRANNAELVDRMAMKYRMADAIGLEGVRLGIPDAVFSEPGRAANLAEEMVAQRSRLQSHASDGRSAEVSLGLDGVLVEGQPKVLQ